MHSFLNPQNECTMKHFAKLNKGWIEFVPRKTKPRHVFF